MVHIKTKFYNLTSVFQHLPNAVLVQSSCVHSQTYLGCTEDVHADQVLPSGKYEDSKGTNVAQCAGSDIVPPDF